MTTEYQEYKNLIDFIINISPAENEKEAIEYLTNYNKLVSVAGYDGLWDIRNKLLSSDNIYFSVLANKLIESQFE